MAERPAPLRRAARPLGLLLPRRRLDPDRAGRRRGRARLPRAGPHRPRRGLGLDGVRPGLQGAWGQGDHRGRADPARGRLRARPPHPAGRRPGRLPQPLPAAHRGPLPHPRQHRAQRRAALGDAGAGRGPRRGAGLPLRLRPRRRCWRAPGSAASARGPRRGWAGGCWTPSAPIASGSSCSGPTGATTAPATAGSRGSPSGSGCPAWRPATSTPTTRRRAHLQDAFVAVRLGKTLEESEPQRRGNPARRWPRRGGWPRASPSTPRRSPRPCASPSACAST